MNDLVPLTHFDEMTTLTLRSIQSDNSQRVYRQSFNAWASWCSVNEVDTLHLLPGNVLDFLESEDTSKSTRQRHLAALRKLANILYILHPTDDNRRILEGLKLIKPPIPKVKKERVKTALTPAQADKLLRVWSEDDSLIGLRNHALIATLLLTGVRRDEACHLQWSDVDFENGVILVRHGKGDKLRHVPVSSDLVLESLKKWHMRLASDRVWIFCPVRKGDNLGEDHPIMGNDVWKIVKKAAKEIGLSLKPHDLRLTLGTEQLSTGSPIHEVQANLGHASGATTLKHYAQATDARERKRNIKIRYGS